jgi:hypothetical protein
MEFAKKEFSYYWKIIMFPLFLLIGWSILGIIIASFSVEWYFSIFGQWQGLVIQVMAFGFIGYCIVAEHKGEVRHSAWGGAITGALLGLVGAILSLIAYYFIPQIIQASLSQAAQQGISMDQLMEFAKIGLYAGFITGPLFGGLIGAGISAIAGAIANRRTKKKK